jgi:hypothetical protein
VHVQSQEQNSGQLIIRGISDQGELMFQFELMTPGRSISEIDYLTTTVDEVSVPWKDYDKDDSESIQIASAFLKS